MTLNAKFYRFPDQGPTLAALDRLDAICREQGITRTQALAALDPIRRRWYPHDSNVLDMLASSVEVPRLPDGLVRPALLAALTPAEREALCGGMDASPHLRPASDFAGVTPAAEARLLRFRKFRQDPASAARFVPAGAPAILEYRILATGHPPGEGPRALSVPVVGQAERPMEVWWAGEGEDWSEARSLRWRADPGPPGQDWAVPLEDLPHWDPARVRLVRVLVRSKGPLAVGTPRLLR
jgi:hypothetical protein